MPDQWIVIPNWERFQHYKFRNPPWIRVYTDLLHKDEYLGLSMTQRGLLHGIWLAYAESDGQLRTGAELRSWLGPDIRPASLERLNQAGFIGFSASRPLSLYKQVHARTRENKKSSDRRQAAENWIRNGAASEVPAGHLAEVIADEFHIEDPQLVAELVTRAQESRM